MARYRVEEVLDFLSGAVAPPCSYDFSDSDIEPATEQPSISMSGPSAESPENGGMDLGEPDNGSSLLLRPDDHSSDCESSDMTSEPALMLRSRTLVLILILILSFLIPALT